MAGFSSNRLKEKKEKILELWAERSLKEIPSAGTSVTLALRDSVPLYLDHLSDALATNRKMDFASIATHKLESVRIGKMHGADRASNRSYVLTEVIFEYHILREVIFQVLETDGPLAQAQRDIILDSIEQAVNDAAVEFSEAHADIQQKFINTLTHDLKTPITAAKMNMGLILRQPNGSGGSGGYANRAIVSLSRLEAMIHDLLDASRVRAGEQLQLQFIECDLEKMVRDILDEMTVIHGDRFVLDSKGELLGNWGCDGLRRAIENLLGNAVKYGSPDAPITLSLRRAETAILVTVHNEGPPISEGEIALLFQQYRRSKSAQVGSKTGWGLGLTLVKGVVEAHKGKVRVESSEGKGTSFILEIPFGQAPMVDGLRNAG
jgi:signal transduction histidine kinase